MNSYTKKKTFALFYYRKLLKIERVLNCNIFIYHKIIIELPVYIIENISDKRAANYYCKNKY